MKDDFLTCLLVPQVITDSLNGQSVFFYHHFFVVFVGLGGRTGGRRFHSGWRRPGRRGAGNPRKGRVTVRLNARRVPQCLDCVRGGRTFLEDSPGNPLGRSPPSFPHLCRISEARRRLMRAADAVPPTRDHAKKPLLPTLSSHSDGGRSLVLHILLQ